MTTLEKWVKATLEGECIIVTENLVKAAAEQIEKENSFRDYLYSPKDWLEDTRDNFPEILLTEEMFGPICKWLIEQRNECMDQAGHFPCLYDYRQGFDCEAFEGFLSEEFKMIPEVSLDDVFNFLLLHYERGGKLDG